MQFNNSGVFGASSGLTFDGTTLTANALTVTNATTLSAGTANGVAYLNGSKVLTTGSALTFDGTNFVLGTGGTSGGFPFTQRVAASGSPVSAFRITNGSDSTFDVTLQTSLASIGNGIGSLAFLQAGTEGMRLTSTGLGIGTSSPGAKLSVDSGATGLMSIFNSTDANGGYIAGRSSGTAVWDIGTAKQALNVGGAADFGINVRNGFLSLGTGNTERMRLDASGNLGLGVTPQSAVANNKWLEINGATALSAYNAGGVYAYSLWGNAVAGKGINGGKASEFTWDSNSGAFVWRQTASSTAGASLSGSVSVMTLDASGNLAVGTTSTTYRLNVVTSSGPYIASFYNSNSSTSQYNVVLFQQAASGSATGYIGTGGSAVSNASFANNFVVGTQTSSALVFNTADTERARIDSSGNLSMTGGGAVNFNNNTGARPGSSGQYIVTADAGGFYQQAGGSYYLVTTTGGNTSDATLKKNVQQLSGALEKICAIRGVNFEFIEEQMSTPDNGVQVGVIAQEVEAQYPEIVVTNEDGIKSVRYEKLVAPLIEAIKEQQAIIEQLKADVAALKGAA